jgi:hypothetical protein
LQAQQGTIKTYASLTIFQQAIVLSTDFTQHEQPKVREWARKAIAAHRIKERFPCKNECGNNNRATTNWKKITYKKKNTTKLLLA